MVAPWDRMRSPRGPSRTRPQMPSSSSACSIAAAEVSRTRSESPRPVCRAQARAAASVARTRSGTASARTSTNVRPASSSILAPPRRSGMRPNRRHPQDPLCLCLLQLRRAQLHLVDAAGADGRPDEVPEERVRPLGPAAQLRVELAGHEPRVVGQLDDLDEPAVRREAAQDEARLLQHLPVLVVELEAVAVALVDHLL